ncbi:MAG TPA: biotin synthase [Rhodoferax sp.]|nr:biotin synthase [Rhodoferax sp.]
MADQNPPSVDPQAARRWHTRPVAESAWLHEEVARRMQERLDWIKRQPQSWVHWAPLNGGMAAHALLQQRYPKAACTLVETSEARAQHVARTVAPPWWQAQRWLHAKPQVVTQVTQPAQMLWANMSLHLTDQPQALLQQWHQALAVDGFLMFSCLGPDTLKELRALYRTLGWPAPSHEVTDMHDWGDMLVAAGFAEPVMDMERITLTFETPQRVLQELRGLGRNLHLERFQALRGRRWHSQLLQAIENSAMQLTFEVVYGHAFKPAPKLSVRAQSEISLDQMRAALTRGKVQGAARAIPKPGLDQHE